MRADELLTAEARQERDRWIRLFNRLDAAITHHRNALTAGNPELEGEPWDEALYAAQSRIMRDAAQGVASQEDQTQEADHG